MAIIALYSVSVCQPAVLEWSWCHNCDGETRKSSVTILCMVELIEGLSSETLLALYAMRFVVQLLFC